MMCLFCDTELEEGFGHVCEACQRRATYMKFNCPECGHSLRVMGDYVDMSTIGPTGFRTEKRTLIRHCDNCYRDWENVWTTQFGDVSESATLKQKFWG